MCFWSQRGVLGTVAAEGEERGVWHLESAERTLPREQRSDQGDPSCGPPAPEGVDKEDGETIYKSLE